MANYSYGSRSNYKPRSLRRSENQAKNRLFLNLLLSGGLIVVFLIWGLPTIVGGLSLLNKIKSPPSSNSSLEDPAIAPPVLNIPFEATNSASIRINGYSSTGSKVEIFFDDELKDTVQTSDDGKFTTNELTLSLGKNNIYGKTVNSDGKKSLSSKTIVLTYSNQKPKLEISSPPDNQQIKGGDKKIVASGKTDPLNSISINGTTAIVNNAGNFSATISIHEGDNTITITVTDQFGNTNQVERKVNYAP